MCDSVELDVTQTGEHCMSFDVNGGQNNNLESGKRCFKICSPSSIVPSKEIVTKQTAMVTDSLIRFKVPEFNETDVGCGTI